jgi:hypothetical protein
MLDIGTAVSDNLGSKIEARQRLQVDGNSFDSPLALNFTARY